MDTKNETDWSDPLVMAALLRTGTVALNRAKALAEQAEALLAACDAKAALDERTKKEGQPPHADYWHQSIWEADKRMAAAMEALRAAIKG